MRQRESRGRCGHPLQRTWTVASNNARREASRSPDMSAAAGAAMRAVLQQLRAVSVREEAREEAGMKLRKNHARSQRRVQPEHRQEYRDVSRSRSSSWFESPQKMKSLQMRRFTRLSDGFWAKAMQIH